VTKINTFRIKQDVLELAIDGFDGFDSRMNTKLPSEHISGLPYPMITVTFSLNTPLFSEL
jgi:hypothetical protein